MTHAESQDLLLDLAFGELDASRAAELEEHVAGCAACREEKAALDEARRLSAPLRTQEEPPKGFDDRILEAARAEAHHQHDGNVGKVIEVTGNVRPLGVEAARIDAHAPVKARPAGRRPKWMVRAALGGSVAAAAALALVVSTTLDARRSAERASQAQPDEYRIRVKPAAPDDLARAGPRENEGDRAAAGEKKQERPAAPPAAQAPAQSALDRTEEAPGAAQGSPPAAFEKKDRVASLPAPPRKAKAEQRKETAAGSVAANRDAPAASGSATVPISSKDKVAAPGRPAAPAAVAEAAARGDVAGQATARQEKPAAEAKELSRMRAVAAAPATDPAGIEANAQQARHGGNYVLAASLYRQAADLRRRNDDAAAAAWNLAHAVECLAAAARFDEGQQVRDELSRLYPGETAALSAAHRALREVDAPQPPPASEQK